MVPHAVGVRWPVLRRSAAFPLLLLLSLAGCRQPAPGHVPGHRRYRHGASWRGSSGIGDRTQYPFGATQPDAEPQAFLMTGAPRVEQLYGTLCASCHGAEGRGEGIAGRFNRVPPTDFTRAEFKVRSTAMGALPTDRDLDDVIRHGAGGDGAMPPFPLLSAEDRRALAQKVKSFSERWRHERPPLPVALPAHRTGDASRGAGIYRAWDCVGCHGPGGAGDGPRVPSLRDARGSPESPADLTRPWQFKRGGTQSELLRTILTGFNGTSMTAYAPADRSGAELWDLVAFVRSLQRPRPSDPLSPHDATTVNSYWRPPLRAGTEPIASAACGTCHPLQFADWSRSRHAMAMGPGVWAQMRERNDGSCAACHAPLVEQAADAFLQADSVSCAACHVREGRTFGPEPTAGTLLPLVAGTKAGHAGGIQARPFFEQSAFCAGCHHFAPGTAPMVEGTTLQNTYEEWRQSRAAKEGRTCQTCHMPDRRHFFRGIHDPETVRRAVRWTFNAESPGTGVTARMTLTNVGAGHFFPTYVVPEIWMRIELHDSRGATLKFAEHRIARKVKADAGGWIQTSDTRLAPDQTATLDYAGPVPPAAVRIVGRVVVLPDVWQAEKFRARHSEAQSDIIRNYYQAALAEAESSGYTLFREERPLPR